MCDYNKNIFCLVMKIIIYKKWNKIMDIIFAIINVLTDDFY